MGGEETQSLGTPNPGRKRKRKGGDSEEDEDDDEDSEDQGDEDEEEEEEERGKKGKKVETCEEEVGSVTFPQDLSADPNDNGCVRNCTLFPMGPGK